MSRILWTAITMLLVALAFSAITGVDTKAMQGTAAPAGSLIYVPVTVTDNKNVPIATLKQENFQVLEDNKEQKIAYFSGAGEPMSVSIILGLSARGPVQSPGQRDRVTVDIATSVERVREANGVAQTGVLDQVPLDSDGLLTTVSRRVEAMRSDMNPRKALVVISDGMISSGIQGTNVPQPRALIELSKTLQFPIHFLVLSASMQAPGFQEGGNFTTGYYLEQMADFSGGQLVSGHIENTLEKTASDLRDMLKNQYVIGYPSPNLAKDGKWRKIAVKVTAPAGAPKMKIVTKERYFVPKP